MLITLREHGPTGKEAQVHGREPGTPVHTRTCHPLG